MTIGKGYRQILKIQFHNFYEQTEENHVFPYIRFAYCPKFENKSALPMLVINWFQRHF
jgi:hypothetical protein